LAFDATSLSGAVAGGLIGEAFGVRAVLLLAAVGMPGGVLRLLLSPVPLLRDPGYRTTDVER
jgi:hypothetical protein